MGTSKTMKFLFGKMSNKLIKPEWLKELAEEIDALIVETIFTSRWALVEGYHKVGQLLKEAEGKYDVMITDLLQGIAEKIQKSERTLWYAVKLYELYPKLDKVPEGKNISWNKLITKYLTNSDKSEKKIRCRHCPIHCL